MQEQGAGNVVTRVKSAVLPAPAHRVHVIHDMMLRHEMHYHTVIITASQVEIPGWGLIHKHNSNNAFLDAGTAHMANMCPVARTDCTKNTHGLELHAEIMKTEILFYIGGLLIAYS